MIEYFLDGILFTGMLVLSATIYGFRNFVNRKAANLAQKQDLQALTDIVQRVQHLFDKAKLVHRVQFEAEFRSYENLFAAANEVHKHFVILYSLIAHNDPVPGEEQTRFIDSQIAFSHILEGSRPFIADAVWNAFHDFEDHMLTGKEIPLMSSKPYLERDQFRKAARLAFEKCGTTIKERLNNLQVIEDA